MFGYLVPRRSERPAEGRLVVQADQREPATPTGQAPRTQEVAVHLTEHVAAHETAVGHPLLHVDRQIPVLEEQDLDSRLGQGEMQLSPRVGDAVERYPSGAECRDDGIEIAPLGQSEANHDSSDPGSPAAARPSTPSEKPAAETGAPSCAKSPSYRPPAPRGCPSSENARKRMPS